PEPVEAAPRLQGRGLVSAYVALTKPRVVSLLLFTTVTAAFAAAGGWPGFTTLVCLILGGYMSAGAANAINMVIDRDIDLEMGRTAKRPTVSGAISPRNALIFAGTLALGAFTLLWAGGTLLAAAMALSGLVFYVVVYTLFLKRRTPHNIVIGGAAGAFPPLVGWAGVTGTLPPLALYLFAIVFLWTPWHFWALAIWLKDEYKAASIPMLPVVRGERETVVQIGLYSLLTIAVTLAPLWQPRVGWIYGSAAILLNIGLVYMFLPLWRQVDRPRAFALFKFSMLYLALLFLAFAIDRSVWA
ncbi:protoheme IX farnesyltransferase, partial [bacterium]